MATNNIRTDLHLVTGNEGYVDVDIYATLPTGEEYLERVFKVVGKEGFARCGGRYAANAQATFNDINCPMPAEVEAAIVNRLPAAHRMILEAEAKLAGPELLRGVSSSTLRLAATLEKTIANIKADPTHPINVRLTEILCDWRDNMKAGKVLK